MILEEIFSLMCCGLAFETFNDQCIPIPIFATKNDVQIENCKEFSSFKHIMKHLVWKFIVYFVNKILFYSTRAKKIISGTVYVIGRVRVDLKKE